MIGQQKVNINEHKPSKFIENADGYEVTSNDGTVKIALRHMTTLDGSMESGFYYTVIWVLEDGGWTKVNNTQSYRTKQEFLNALEESEGFAEAFSEYRFNNQNNNEQ